MNIGFIGAGKLGFPVALAIESKGHNVVVCDTNPDVANAIDTRDWPHKEEGIADLLANTKIKTASLEQIVHGSDIVFCAIQTPHDPKYEGATRLPEERKDFDYQYLVRAVADVADAAQKLQRHTTLVVISTCLPGTFKREIEPLLNEYVHYVYNPFFIAMGTVIHDFLNPEFVLVGSNADEQALSSLQALYATLHDKPVVLTDITTAEAIKVSYNTFITMKTVLANTWGEIAHKTGANVDDIYKAWGLATDRLISPKYLKSGVGDGGGCHPRDNIALSWLAEDLKLSHNMFEDLMKSREDHMAWLAHEAVKLARANEMPLIILGRSFKPETNIETGSASVLMANVVAEYGIPFDHVEDIETTTPAVFVLGTQHDRYTDYSYPDGSVVLDPFGIVPVRTGVEVIRIGR